MLNEGDATHAFEIAEQEVRRFANLWREELDRTAPRADGNYNAGDFDAALRDALDRYAAGEVAQVRP